jgi:hypothetical protein
MLLQEWIEVHSGTPDGQQSLFQTSRSPLGRLEIKPCKQTLLETMVLEPGSPQVRKTRNGAFKRTVFSDGNITKPQRKG